MSDVPLVDPPASPELGARRHDVLARLREAGHPLGVADLAQLSGLHPNTVRFHLDALVADGLAERTVEPRPTPGRRRVLYAATPLSPGPRSYGLLAEMLTGLVASMDGGERAAVEAGRAWGRHLIERPAPSERLEAGEALARLYRLFSDVGFAPELADSPGERHAPPATAARPGAQIRLHHCPFLEVAARHREIVCSLHLGLMEGALDELHSPLRAEGLDPFVTPGVCLARLGRGDEMGAS